MVRQIKQRTALCTIVAVLALEGCFTAAYSAQAGSLREVNRDGANGGLQGKDHGSANKDRGAADRDPISSEQHCRRSHDCEPVATKKTPISNDCRYQDGRKCGTIEGL